MISYSHRFIFIHIYKVAGSSIRKALEKYTQILPLNRLLIKLGIQNPYEAFSHHAKAKDFKARLSRKLWNRLYKFAFVRNPWDWQVSLYYYMLQEPSNHQHNLIKEMRSFDEYIEWRVSQDLHFQKDFVTDDNGELIVDFVGRYENLLEDFHFVCQNLGINAKLPYINKSKHEDYRKYYNRHTIKLIEEYFQEDIEFFKYTFDGSDQGL